MTSLVRLVLCGLIVALVSGCGSAAHVAASVHGKPISTADVNRWAAVARSSNGAAPAGAPGLEGLIGAHWAIAEARALGISVSAKEVGHRTKGLIAAAGGGDQASFTLAALAALSAEAIRRHVSSTAGAPSPQEVARFYAQHRARYRAPEEREFDLVENLVSRRAALALARRVGTGKRFTSMGYRETFARPATFTADEGKGATLHAIFSAKLGVIGGPTGLNGRYALFVVRRIIGGGTLPLAHVSARVTGELVAIERRQLLGAFYRSYRRRWRQQTSCAPGFVVRTCRQYGVHASQVG